MKKEEDVKMKNSKNTYKVKSVVISRKPGKDKDTLKTAFIGLFNENNPHLKAKDPLSVLEFKEIEKVRIRELRNISYYLLGNDIVINNLVQLEIDVKDHIVTLTGTQDLPEGKE
jgi:NCAIR mutase (PurE)-related protein